MSSYDVKDSGARETFQSGMLRDTEHGKPRFDLIFPEEIPYEHQLLTRIAMRMAAGATKYGDRNWESGYDPGALARAKSSADRHYMQWRCGETDEDHAAAVYFNIQQVEYQKYLAGLSEVKDEVPLSGWENDLLGQKDSAARERRCLNCDHLFDKFHGAAGCHFRLSFAAQGVNFVCGCTSAWQQEE